MAWTFDKSESTYSAEFPQSKVRIVVEGDEFAKGADGKEIENSEYLPLIEGRFYHFELIDKDKKAKLSAMSSLGKAARHGSFAPGTAVGFGRLFLEGAEAPELALGVEIASEVVSYRKDYQALLQQLTEEIADLHMQCSSAVHGYLKPDPRKRARHDIQQLFFLLGLVGNSGFEAALRQVVERPHAQLVEVEEEIDSRRSSRLGRSELLQFASSPRRVDLPRHLRGAYAGLDTIPERITARRRIESVDTPENRFVKYAIGYFLDRLQSYRRWLVEKPGKKDAPSVTLEVDLNAAIRMLSRWTSHEFFKGVGPLVRMPTASVVLQRREGYREILKKWLQYQAGTELAWKPGEEVFAANQRKMSALYEYWCFFKLLKIVGGIFNVSTAEVARKMIGKSPDGFSLLLKAGEKLTLEGTFDSGRKGARFRRLAVEYSYNRTFSAKNKVDSWTLPMRPDYTLAFYPQGMLPEIAIQNDLITYVHFDAKYKAKDLSESLTQIYQDKESAVEEGASDVGCASAKDVKRVDILKMHSYRDAIKRTGGAYVLYPGTKIKLDRENGEILPGLGAFTLSPSNDSSKEISDFLKDVAIHLCDRVTRWENYTYRAYEIYRQKKEAFAESRKLIEELTIPEYDDKDLRNGHRVNLDAEAARRYLDPDCYVSVELNEAEKSLKWAYEHNLFILPKRTWDKLNKPSPDRITLISVAWHPPINLLVQRYVDQMQARMIKGRYPSCPYEFRGDAKLDEEYQVWEVRAIDTKTLETRLDRRNR